MRYLFSDAVPGHSSHTILYVWKLYTLTCMKYSGVLRLATPVFGISNISNFNHYKVPHFLKDGCYSYVSLY